MYRHHENRKGEGSSPSHCDDFANQWYVSLPWDSEWHFRPIISRKSRNGKLNCWQSDPPDVQKFFQRTENRGDFFNRNNIEFEQNKCWFQQSEIGQSFRLYSVFSSNSWKTFLNWKRWFSCGITCKAKTFRLGSVLENLMLQKSLVYNFFVRKIFGQSALKNEEVSFGTFNIHRQRNSYKKCFPKSSKEMNKLKLSVSNDFLHVKECRLTLWKKSSR